VAIEILINGSADADARFVSWALSPCQIRNNGAGAGGADLNIKLRTKATTKGGALVFAPDAATKPKDSIALTLPGTGAWVDFVMAGKFGKPSIADGDAAIQVLDGATVLQELPCMVRIRKDANALAKGERDRFVNAMAKLNNRGAGRFADFRNMHTNAGSPEAHGAPGFLPWHRIYLLDLERELQAIDPSVTLPYWRFDRPAPALFNRDFLGMSDTIGRVQFSATNPLQFWTTDGVVGITRRPLFSTSSAGANNVLTEAQTLGLGSDYGDFMDMESNPHGLAHTSFGGSISSIGTAARDPLFFLLHANVDRLWAKWQRQFSRFDPTQSSSFDSNAANGGNRVGHNLPDSMWPWNGVTGAPRPPTAPGGGLASSPCVNVPGPQPFVHDALDYQGAIAATSRLGFDYDDVPFA